MRRLPTARAALLSCAALLIGGCGSATQQHPPRHLPPPPTPGASAPPGAEGAAGSPAGGMEPLRSVPLSTGWRFAADPRDVGRRLGWSNGDAHGLLWNPVSVPGVFNPSVIGSPDAGSVGWYEDTFIGPDTPYDRSWAVRFQEVRRRARVWLNGRPIGASDDPYAPFQLPAGSLKPGQSNTLVVRVDNRRHLGELPEDWWNWGGIVRPVALVPVGRVQLLSPGVMPRLGCARRCGSLLVEATVHNLSGQTQSPKIVVVATTPAGARFSLSHQVAPVGPGASMRISFFVPVPGVPDLWSPGHPALYSLRIATVAGGRVEQVNRLRTGLRQVEVRQGILYLNGKRLWLHGASIHEDMPGHGAALTDADIATIVAELRAVGANVTRAHYLLSERLLDALDAAGILVWSQAPVDHAFLQLQQPAYRAQALDLLRATVLGDRSHPSVFVHSVGNELTPTPDSSPGTRAYLQEAIPLTRQLDPGAVVALDTYCYPGFPAQALNRLVDVLGISHYFGWYRGLPGHPIADFSGLTPFLQQSRQRYPGQALVVAEFGAEGLYDGTATEKGSFSFQSDYITRTFTALDALPFMNGAIYWTLREFAVSPGWTGGARLPTGETPDGLHHKGLIAYDGVTKPAWSVAQGLFNRPPAYVTAALSPASPRPLVARITGATGLSATPQLTLAR